VQKLYRNTTIVLLAAAAAAAVCASPAQATSTDPLIEGAKLCTKQLPQYEKQYGIPAHLLSAIAATESGRYHDDLKIRVPWPWTINANGRGYYFDNKAEAMAAVRKLRAQGVESIDVGCMQVNLHHHPDAFASLDEAFDPQHNVAYAAVFLRALYEDEGSWKRAAADYHSKEPGKGRQYIGQVYDSWQRLVEKLRLAKLQVPASSISEMRGMRSAAMSDTKTGVVYASDLPKPTVRKIAALPEQEGKTIAAYHPAHMNSIQVSKKESPKSAGVMYIQPEIQTAAARAVLPDTGILRIDSPAAGTHRSGPNFIFND
jgi:Transglycosylase SLT domain